MKVTDGFVKYPSQKFLLIGALLVVSALLPVAGASAAPTAANQTRVIVTLAVPQSHPDASAAIAQTTDALLATLPAGDYTVINRPSVLPYLTLSTGASAMSVLRSSGLVAAIERDGTVSSSKVSGKGKRKCKVLTLGNGSIVKMCKKAKKVS